MPGLPGLSEAVLLTPTRIQGRDVSYALPYTGRYFLHRPLYKGETPPMGGRIEGEITPTLIQREINDPTLKEGRDVSYELSHTGRDRRSDPYTGRVKCSS